MPVFSGFAKHRETAQTGTDKVAAVDNEKQDGCHETVGSHID